MHPELCVADTTFGTNNKKKELFTLAFKDGNNNVFNGARAYIPNAQKWVFSMMFKECLPNFWGSTISDRISLVMTDGCQEEYISFIQNVGIDQSFRNASLGLCYFHLAIQPLLKNITIPKSGIAKKRADPVISIIKMWIKSWFFDVETCHEYTVSVRLFFQFLDKMENEHTLHANLVEEICLFVKSKLNPYEPMWVNYHRLFIGGMNGRTTSIGEQMHWSMKSGFDKIVARMSPEKSADTMMNKAQRRGQKQARKNAQKDAKLAINNESTIANELTTWCEEKFKEQYELSKYQRVTQVDSDCFYVFEPDHYKGKFLGFENNTSCIIRYNDCFFCF